jgi:hypothetical protein
MKLPAPNTDKLIFDRARVEDVAAVMVEVIRLSSREPYVVNLAQQLEGTTTKETVQNFCLLVYKAAYFQPDLPSSQTIRTLRRLIIDGCGNCVDYTTAIASLAVAAKIPVTLALVQLPGQTDFGHVFPIIDGIIADVVPGQKQDGSERRKRPAGSSPVIGSTTRYEKIAIYPV